MRLRNLLRRRATNRDDALAIALADLAENFGNGMTAMHTGGLFTCGEADAIARVLLLSGYKDEALMWLGHHAAGDGVGDSHFVCDEDDPEDEGCHMTEWELREYAGELTA